MFILLIMCMNGILNLESKNISFKNVSFYTANKITKIIKTQIFIYWNMISEVIRCHIKITFCQFCLWNCYKWHWSRSLGLYDYLNLTHLLKNLLNLFVCIKLTISLQFSFLYLIYSLGGYNKTKKHPRRPRIQF